jgi:uncharacterized protein
MKQSFMLLILQITFSGIAQNANNAYHEPSYAPQSEEFLEKEIIVKTDSFALKGIFTYPKNQKNSPIVVFVHGSGPSDRDESIGIGPNKVFRDLALGLVANGIASVRYDKRTKVYPTKMNLKTITVREETIDDALSAIALAKTLPNISPEKIFLLGHSLGGMLAPRIAQEKIGLAGILMLAAPARPFEDLVYEQVVYSLKLDGSLSKQDSISMKMYENLFQKVKVLNVTEPILGLPAIYWNDLNQNPQVIAAQKLSIPMMILQGESDFQVSMTDYNLWQKALKGKQNIEFRSYPTLNHLFMKSISELGKACTQEYQIPQNVSEKVILDIVKFCKTQK